jgi:hypothetical protein
MREYELRKGLASELGKILLECFGNPQREGAKVVARLQKKAKEGKL